MFRQGSCQGSPVEAASKAFLAPGGRSGGRLGGQEPRTVGFADSCTENAGFAQAAGRAQAAAPRAKSPRRKPATAIFLYR